MNWQLVPQFAITGLLAGGPIALTALGLVLIFKSSYIFNFAQGQLLLMGALITWWLSVEHRSAPVAGHPPGARPLGAAGPGSSNAWRCAP